MRIAHHSRDTAALAVALAVALCACPAPAPRHARVAPHKASTTPRPSPAPPTGILLATFHGETVRFFKVGSTVKLQHAVKLPEHVTGLQWLARSRLAALLDSGKVMQIAGAGATPLTFLPAAAWKLPNPQPDNEAVSSSFPHEAYLYRSRGGGLWLAHCAWAHQGDGDPCATWVHGRLLPSPGKPQLQAPARPARRGPPGGSAAKGYTVQLSTDAGQARFRCLHGGKLGLEKSFSQEPCSHRLRVTWLAQKSRRLLLTAEADCGVSDTPSITYYLVNGCVDPPQTFHQLSWGPRGLMAGNREVGGEHQWLVQRTDGELLGQIKGSSPLHFWPR